MTLSRRIGTTASVILFAFLLSGCYCGPDPVLRAAQLSARNQWAQNQTLATAKNDAEMRAAQMASQLDLANQRLANLTNEREELQNRYVSLLNQATNPLGNDMTRKFEELARKYPEFEFDPNTGVAKFHADVLFDSGSAELKSSASKLLKEFADLMNSPDASRFHILVVGHTDDRPIEKAGTANKHPTNWHLSTNRANSVVMTLSKYGMRESRMGAAGYSKFQPVEPNSTDSSRQRNRRVEIFILAPEANVAAWDPGTSIQ